MQINGDKLEFKFSSLKKVFFRKTLKRCRFLLENFLTSKRIKTGRYRHVFQDSRSPMMIIKFLLQWLANGVKNTETTWIMRCYNL